MMYGRALMGLTILLCWETVRADAREPQRVEPIVLTTSPSCCQSPAALASEPMALLRGHYTARVSTIRDSVDGVAVSSQLQPLPASSPVCRNYTVCSTPTPAEPVTLYRPTLGGRAAPGTRILVPPVQSLRDGYVVGRGLIGQPKLYKPGQPIRNFLRFISF